MTNLQAPGAAHDDSAADPGSQSRPRVRGHREDRPPNATSIIGPCFYGARALRCARMNRVFLLSCIWLLGACSPGPAPTQEASPDADLAIDASEVEDTGDDTQLPPSPDAPPTDTPSGCANDDPCPEGTICEDTVCLPGCRFDGACPDGEICEDDTCTPGCRNPADCNVGHTCRQGVCVSEGCGGDTQCPGDARCIDGGCLQIGAADCEQDADCGHR
jgi:hypothetical protein